MVRQEEHRPTSMESKGEINHTFIREDSGSDFEDSDKFQDTIESDTKNPVQIKETSDTNKDHVDSDTGDPNVLTPAAINNAQCGSNNNNNSYRKSIPTNSTDNSSVVNGRRRSSVEIIRQSRAYKRFSRALSSVGLHLPEITEYQLEGITEEVRNFYFS